MRGRASALIERLQARLGEIGAHPPVAAVLRRWRAEYGLAMLAVGTAIVAAINIDLPDKAPDFTVFWAAARHAFEAVYDSEFLSPLQPAPPGPRPFAYPPTFLLMILPFGLLSFKAAYVAAVTLSVTGFVAAGLRWSGWAWLALVSPTLIFAALIGQSTLVVGALLMAGLMLAGVRPVLAGVALGIAGCIKPQLLVLAPLALVLLRDGRAMLAAAVTAALLALAATLVFGPAIWGEWLRSLAQFRAINDQLAIERLGIGTNLAAVALVLPVVALLMWRAVRDGDRARLAAATIGGSVLLSPHAVFYESAVLLLPALALVGLNWRLVPIAYLLLGGATTTVGLALVLLGLTLPLGPGRIRSAAAAPPA